MTSRTTESAPERIPHPSKLWPKSKDVDDMSDLPKELSEGTHLAKAIKVCDETLGSGFKDYDGKAITQQWRHVWIVRVAATLGSLSILMTIWQLFFGGDLEAFEVVAGAFAAGAVVLGIFAAVKNDWLVNRYRAERLRALKFSYLMGPASWSNEPAELERARADLQVEVTHIKDASIKSVDVWLEHLQIWDRPTGGGADYAMELDKLRDYYIHKRLGKQGWFFYRRAHYNELVNSLTNNLSQFLFFGAVVAALLHFGLQVFASSMGLDLSSNRWMGLSAILVLVALALPVISSGVRTIRGSREFARNRMRYRANYLMLVRLDEELRKSANHAELMFRLYEIEEAFELELREWLGLMREAEWYG